ncbi:MAG: YfhO family protein, partial [Clostridiaceae bacterium]|nr:YfhO family protein [Clostridiaceae bacterium]
FIGLRMPQGAHEYHLRFVPNGLLEGFAITVAFFVATLGWVYAMSHGFRTKKRSIDKGSRRRMNGASEFMD